MKFKMTKKKWILLAVVVVGGALIANSLNSAGKMKPSVTYATLSQGEVKSYLSTTGKVTNGGLEEHILSGNSEVKEVYFKAGDTVKAGDLIVAFDSEDAMTTYKEAAIVYEKQRLTLEESERTYFEQKEDIQEQKDDLEWLRQKRDEYDNSTDPEEILKFDNYYAKWEAAKSKLESMEKSLMSDEQIKIAQLNFEQARMNMEAAEKAVNELPANIVAKGDGVIETISTVKYNKATKGQKAVTIRTTATTTVDFNIGRYDLGKVAVGQSVEVTVSGKTYQGTISKIDPVATTESYVKATIDITNPEGLIPGVDVDVEILIYSADSVLRAPIESVKTDKTGDYCYILTPAETPEGEAPLFTPVKTYVTTGNSSDTYIEITGGVESGAQIVVSPPKNIDLIPVCTAVDVTATLV